MEEDQQLSLDLFEAVSEGRLSQLKLMLEFHPDVKVRVYSTSNSMLVNACFSVEN